MFADTPLRGVALNLAYSCSLAPPAPPRPALTRLPPRARVYARCASSERTPRHLGRAQLHTAKGQETSAAALLGLGAWSFEHVKLRTCPPHARGVSTLNPKPSTLNSVG